MVQFLLQETIGTFVDALRGGRRESRLHRRNERRFEDGGEAVFEGSILGNRWYCRPRAYGGTLVAAPGRLSWSPDPVGKIARVTVPVGDIRVEASRPASRQEAGFPGWAVLECREGDEPVRIVCSQHDLSFVQRALAGAA